MKHELELIRERNKMAPSKINKSTSSRTLAITNKKYNGKNYIDKNNKSTKRNI